VCGSTIVLAISVIGSRRIRLSRSEHPCYRSNGGDGHSSWGAGRDHARCSGFRV